MFIRSDRAAYLKLSEMVQSSEKVQACRGVGEDLFSFGMVDLDFPRPETKWLSFNAPIYPTRALYSADELSALAGASRANLHISYATFTSFCKFAPNFVRGILIVDDLPKAYAIIGWRLGRGIGPREPIDTMVGVQGQSTFDASSILLASSLTGSRDVFGECLEPLRGRRDFIISELNKTDRSDCLIPVGAVYAFPCCVKTFGFKMPNGTEITSYAEFCPYLLKAAVAVVPSHAFGLSGHFRLSYAYAMAELKQSCARITKAVAALSQRIIECH